MISSLLLALAALSPFQESEVPPPIRPLEGLEETLVAARAEDKPALVVFGAVWCATCRSFRKHTLPDTEVRRAAANFVVGTVDVDRAPHLARAYEVTGTPCILVLDGEGKVVSRLGGDPGPAALATFLDAVHGGDRVELPHVEVTGLVWTPGGYRGEAICFSHVGYGPLRVSSQSAGNVLRLALEPRTPSTLLKGQVELRWTETLTNYWAFAENNYRLDFGALQSQIAVGYGLTDTVQAELGFIDYRRFESVLDDITNAFHNIFGLDESGRDLFPEHENVISINDAGILSDDEDRYTQDLSLTIQHNLTCGTEHLPALAWALAARTNLGGNIDLDGAEDISVGLSLSAARRVSESWYLYGSLGYLFHGLDVWRGIKLRDTQLSALFAAEYRYAPRAAWIFQVLYTQEVARNLRPFDEPSYEFDLGWKKEIADGTVLELGLLENAFTVDNSPDVGFHFGLTHRF